MHQNLSASSFHCCYTLVTVGPRPHVQHSSRPSEATRCPDNILHTRELTFNFSKTNIAIFGARLSASVDFAFNGNVIDRHDHYRYLGFTFNVTKNMAFGVSYLVGAAKRAVHAMGRRCAYLHLRDTQQQCKLFDILVLPILSYGSEVRATDPKVGAAAEVLHRQFLECCIGIRDSTASSLVLVELGWCSLQIHFWQQMLWYHNRFFKLDSVRLSKVAKLAGTHLDSEASAWKPLLSAFS